MNSRPHSIHTFMWPFRWSAEKKNGNDLLESFSKYLLKDTTWKEVEFKLSNSQHYNEYVYYHSHVRNTLFAYNDNKDIVRFFEYELQKDAVFEFEVITKVNNNGDIENKKTFKLAIKGISLHLFFTGVGILTFQLEYNDDNTTVEDIQLINDFGRRTYPQFLGANANENYNGLNATNRAFLPTYVKTSYCNEIETFESYTQYKNASLQEIVQPPAYIKALFCNDFVFNEITNPDKEKITITHLTDDRMFTLCWYSDDSLSNELKDIWDQKYNYLNSKKWYELIFCDKSGNLTCQSDLMLEEHIKRYTYDRWVNYGTLYGITRDCLFCLTDEGDFARDTVLPHIQSIYYQMAIICLAQRASVQKISYDLTQILKSLDGNQLNSAQIDQAVSIQAMYLKFNNLLYFKEVTDQIQGIEMYQKMQESMAIQGITDQLDREIEELHSLLNMNASLELSKEANLISFIATYFVPASFVVGVMALFSDNLNFSDDFSQGKFKAILVLVVTAIALLFMGKAIIKNMIKMVKKYKKNVV